MIPDYKGKQKSNTNRRSGLNFSKLFEYKAKLQHIAPYLNR